MYISYIICYAYIFMYALIIYLKIKSYIQLRIQDISNKMHYRHRNFVNKSLLQ